MNLHIRQFLAMYLPIVFGSLLLVGFFAFIAIPYVLGGHPGEDSMAETTLQAPQQASSQAPQV